ncbi:5'-nucleotidase [Alteromonadaceae bacterium 2753L.S.0a.02]|nr:5'-nucleotidase [Alteromonadaceae bacterium 2753L.S.0a.02]
MKTITRLFRSAALPSKKLAAASLAVMVACTFASADALSGAAHKKHNNDFTLTILHNNDGESSLLPFEIDGVEYGGIGQFKTMVDKLRFQAKRQRQGVLLLNSGDNFLAGTTFQASREAGAPFYDALGIRLLRYDALAIGNHEFDFGPDVFNEFIEGVNSGWRDVPFVSANLDYSDDVNLSMKVGDELVSSTVIRERGHWIGVVGLTTPTLPAISSPVTVKVLDNLAEIAQAEIDRLSYWGVKHIILVSHLQGLASEIALVSELKNVDVVIGGGGDEILGDVGTDFFPGDEDDIFGSYPQVATDAQGKAVPVVTTPGNYKYVGRLVVNFNKKGEVTSWDVDDSGIQLVTGLHPNFLAKKFIEEPVAAFIDALAANIIGTSEVALDCERAEVRGVESNCGNLMADSLFAAASKRAADFGLPQPDVAFQNGGGIRGEIDQPAGPFSEADTFRLAPFSNFVSLATDVPAETFRQIVEEGSVRLPASGDGGFIQASGFSYVIDTSFPARVTEADGTEVAAGQRVRSLVLDNGTVVVANGVAADMTLTVVSNDFSLNGGDGYPALSFTRLGVSYQQALSDFISIDLGGVISAADYPVGGEGRITIQ